MKYLFLILILAIFLRLMGTNPGYYTTHPDEPTITESVKKIVLNFNFEPQAYYYGSLLALIYAVPTFFILYPFLISSFVLKHYQILIGYGLHIAKITEVWNTYINQGRYFEYWVRYETAILSGFTVIIAYFLGRKLFNKKVGLVTAFFIAVNYRHVLSSSLSLADGPSAFFVLLSIFLSTKLLDKLSWRNYLLAGFGLGLVLSVKYFVYTIPTFLLCHLFCTWQNSRLKFVPRLIRLVISRKLLGTILTAIMLFSFINIYIFLKPQDALFQLKYNTTKYVVTFSKDTAFNISHINYYSIYYLYKFALGEILSFLVLIGTIYSLIKYSKSSLVLLATILSYLYFFLILSTSTNGRYYSAIIPLILFFPAILTVDFAEVLNKLASKRKIKISLTLLISFLALLAGLQSLKLSFLTSYYFSKSYNSDALQQWVMKEIPDNSTYAYFWKTPTPPANKKINSSFIDLDENVYPSMEDLQESNTDYIVVGSDPGNVINGLFWINNTEIIKKAFFDDTILWEFLDDSYASLITRELAAYRIKEFSKPWPSLDPNFFVVKYPKFWNTKKGDNVNTYNFDKPEDINQWTVSSYSPISYFSISPIANDGFNNSSAMLVKPTNNSICSIPFVKIKSKPFTIEPLKFYILSGWGKRENIVKKEQKNGFIRLDFYSKSNQLLKSYISKQLEATSELQNINAAGMAPKNSNYAQVIVQLDRCLEEKYIFDQLEVTAKNDTHLDMNEYPFFDKKLSKSFIWLPQL